ncbi:MAG: helix-hairpin-helix domain-containing protein, partial [Gammaproteobacteria bacterium]|nr:helix-hairpin-helix domain-containing protein [Gammaproteobacteria bacterium]
ALADGESIEAVGARNVVDGLALIRWKERVDKANAGEIQTTPPKDLPQIQALLNTNENTHVVVLIPQIQAILDRRATTQTTELSRQIQTLVENNSHTLATKLADEIQDLLDQHTVTHTTELSREIQALLNRITGTHAKALRTELVGLQNSIDAIGDLLSYEGVYQAAQGNYERSSAALDVLSAGAYPPEIESIKTPTSGKTISHRVCLLLQEPEKSQTGPRAMAEPRIAAWFSNILGETNSISAEFDFKSERLNINDATLNELESLPGSDDDTAELIIEYRDKNRPLETLDELDNIRPAHDDDDDDREERHEEKRDRDHKKNERNDKHRETISYLKRWLRTGIDTTEEQYYERININHASIDELRLLKGIKKKEAHAIIRNRPFARLQDLRIVHDLENEDINRIRPWVTTGTVTLETLKIDAADLLYITAALPSSLDKLDIVNEDSIDDPLFFESQRLNINLASRDQLAQLPGINKGVAKQIVKYRDHEGLFQNLDSLERIWHHDDDHEEDDDDSDNKEKWHFLTQLLKRWVTTGKNLHEEPFYERININAAPIEELTLLHGISKKKAEQIVSNRPYASVDELVNIRGLKQKTIDELKPWVSTTTKTKSAFKIVSNQVQAEDTELELRIKNFVRTEYHLPSDLPIETNIWGKQYSNNSIGDTIQLAQNIFTTLGVGSMLRPDFFELPSMGTEATYNQDDVDELQQRVAQAQTQICRLILALNDDTEIQKEYEALCPNAALHEIPPKHRHRKDDDDEFEDDDKHREKDDDDHEHHHHRLLIDTLLAASRFNIPEAIPTGPFDPDLLEKKASTCKELIQRLQASKMLTPMQSNVDDKSNDISILVDSLKAIFGNAFIALATFSANNTNELKAAFSQTHFKTQSAQQRLQLWLQQAAKTHPNCFDIEDTLLTTHLWQQNSSNAGKPALSLHVAQLPYDESSQWLGLDDDERDSPINADIDTDRGALSIVAAVGGDSPLSGQAETTRFAGLVMDQWDELIPYNKVDTGVSFHYDAPNNQAPQCLLLAVPSQRNETPQRWQIAELVEIINDTIDLAKIRAVDPDAMGEVNPSTTENDNASSAGDAANANNAKQTVEGVGLMFPSLLFPVDPNNQSWSNAEIADSVPSWLHSLKEQEQNVCQTGELSFVGGLTQLAVDNEIDEPWILQNHESYRAQDYARGIFLAELASATIKVFGTTGTIETDNLYVQHYEVTSYPPTFVEVTVTGTLGVISSENNNEITLTRESETYT